MCVSAGLLWEGMFAKRHLEKRLPGRVAVARMAAGRMHGAQVLMQHQGGGTHR